MGKRNGYVYLIESEGSHGRFKVGRTINPLKRLGEIACSPYVDRCWYRRVAPVNNYIKKERHLLKKFGKKRDILFKEGWQHNKSHPEWLILTTTQVSEIEDLIDQWRVLNG